MSSSQPSCAEQDIEPPPLPPGAFDDLLAGRPEWEWQMFGPECQARLAPLRAEKQAEDRRAEEERRRELAAEKMQTPEERIEYRRTYCSFFVNDPVVYCTLSPGGQSVQFQCSTCGDQHSHGWEPGMEKRPQHRVSHCGDYWIELAPSTNAQPSGNAARNNVPKLSAADKPLPSQPHIRLLCAANVEPEPIKWLWDGWLAAGKLHILAGAPGTGKSTLAFGVAATITTGGGWPDGSQANQGDVLIWSGEDDRKDTIVPRLLACGADVSRVHFVQCTMSAEGPRAFDPAEDMALLQDTIRHSDTKFALLIVDSVVSAVAGDSHKNTETRRGLQPLVDLARIEDCAVLGISHFSKGTAGRDVVERVTGSLAFGALARVVWATAKIPAEQGGGRMLARAKSNIGPDSGGFGYDLQLEPLAIHPGIVATRLIWGQAIEGSAREILARAEVQGADAEDKSTLDGAKEFLGELLASGAMASNDIKEQGKGAGFTWRTLRRAKDALGVKPRKTGMDGPWMWELPPKMARNAEDGQRL